MEKNKMKWKIINKNIMFIKVEEYGFLNSKNSLTSNNSINPNLNDYEEANRLL
jgi:hypothetical protein